MHGLASSWRTERCDATLCQLTAPLHSPPLYVDVETDHWHRHPQPAADRPAVRSDAPSFAFEIETTQRHLVITDRHAELTLRRFEVTGSNSLVAPHTHTHTMAVHARHAYRILQPPSNLWQMLAKTSLKKLNRPTSTETDKPHKVLHLTISDE